jgi:hypothetical protein
VADVKQRKGIPVNHNPVPPAVVQFLNLVNDGSSVVSDLTGGVSEGAQALQAFFSLSGF